MKGWLIVNQYVKSEKFAELFRMLLESATRNDIKLDLRTHADVWGMIADNNYDINEVISEVDFIIFWDKDIKLARILEDNGARLFNSAKSIELCDDKSLTFMALKDTGIEMPKTYIAPKTFSGFTDYDYFNKIADLAGYPLIVKECLGSFGQQVYLAHNGEELIEVIKSIGSRSFILQEYISSSEGRDVRIQVVGDQIVAAMYRYNDNDFRANITNGGSMKIFEPDEEMKKMALAVCRTLELDFGGIDLLFGENDRPVFCEANSNAHFKNLYDCTGINTADYIMKYIRETMK